MQRIGEMLVESGDITEGQLNEALEKQRTDPRHRRLGVILIEMELLTMESLMHVLDRQIKERK